MAVEFDFWISKGRKQRLFNEIRLKQEHHLMGAKAVAWLSGSVIYDKKKLNKGHN